MAEFKYPDEYTPIEDFSNPWHFQQDAINYQASLSGGLKLPDNTYEIGHC